MDEMCAEVWCRVIRLREMTTVVIHNRRVVGAVLIGDTGLEETFENLILNAIDVSCIGLQLLDPEVDIEDYFD